MWPRTPFTTALIGHHIDMSLSETALLAAAGDRIYGRGEEDVRYVRGLRIAVDKAYASVQAKRVYAVELDWSAHRDGEVRRMLEVRATATSGDDTTAKAEFEAYVRNALELHGFVDYRVSYVVAEDAGRVLDELENHLKDGSSEIVRPALLCALTLLRTILGEADDSSGAIGDECQRAADLYAQACRLGEPDPAELARWLVTFRATSPGWPTLVLADFVDAFDDHALVIYRAAVAELDRQHAGRDHRNRLDVDTMLLELADHDGDVDRAGPDAGSVLVQLSLNEGDVDAAWNAADRYGPGWAWEEIATRGAEARPLAAADLYRPQLEDDLQRPDTRLYPGIAERLAAMAQLYERGGRSADFAQYIAKVRQDYGRRPALMKALSAKGL